MYLLYYSWIERNKKLKKYINNWIAKIEKIYTIESKVMVEKL